MERNPTPFIFRILYVKNSCSTLKFPELQELCPELELGENQDQLREGRRRT
ncbi:Hypothetical protein FKW44_010990 [Caligus rogercresseyi]|uniref:Uncharacterized protein n=1 Tax=Caligus rogercresseyi TaxID=217165 RepID=A0A7T8HHL8_CALRO|nr:Hypothetical protein FKW44_010990 [Caligus rogercresseyi]